MWLRPFILLSYYPLNEVAVRLAAHRVLDLEVRALLGKPLDHRREVFACGGVNGRKPLRDRRRKIVRWHGGV